MTLEDLLEIERIRTMRMRYSYCLDACDIDGLAALFTDDAVCAFGPYGDWTGKAMIAENYRKVMAPAIEKGPFQSLHINTNHWVALISATDARGRLYLIDLAVDRPPQENPMLWLGVYDERYVKTAGEWKISRTSLQFMWPKRHVSADFPGSHWPSGE